MEQGSIRCDANELDKACWLEGTWQSKGQRLRISIHLNSLRRLFEYEIKRQIKVIEEGGKIIQETRLWDSDRGITNLCAARKKLTTTDISLSPTLCL